MAAAETIEVWLDDFRKDGFLTPAGTAEAASKITFVLDA